MHSVCQLGRPWHQLDERRAVESHSSALHTLKEGTWGAVYVMLGTNDVCTELYSVLARRNTCGHLRHCTLALSLLA